MRFRLLTSCWCCSSVLFFSLAWLSFNFCMLVWSVSICPFNPSTSLCSWIFSFSSRFTLLPPRKPERKPDARGSSRAPGSRNRRQSRRSRGHQPQYAARRAPRDSRQPGRSRPRHRPQRPHGPRPSQGHGRAFPQGSGACRRHRDRPALSFSGPDAQARVSGV